MPGTRLIGWPFFGILHLRLAVRRSRSKEPILQRVGEGWYIGGWPPSKEIIPEGPLSIIDCTNEYQRTVERPYICLPTWDTQGVNASNIKKAVDFALEQRKLGRAVLVHCAHGHGRSAGVILACMIVAGDVQTIEEGLRQIQEVRPKVKLNGMQRRNLQKYLTTVSKTP